LIKKEIRPFFYFFMDSRIGNFSAQKQLPVSSSSSSRNSSSSSGSSAPELRVLVTPNEQAHKSAANIIDIIAQCSNLRTEAYQLTCGDYAIVSGPRSAKPSECAVVALIERKTRSDLESSIMDGRYKEQAARLLLSGARFVYIYVTPGPLWERSNEQAVHTAILHLQSEYAACAARDGGRVFQVLCSDCDTPARLGRDLGTLARYIAAEANGPRDALLLAAAMQNGAKKKYEAQADVFPAQLGVITGVSFKKAQAVAKAHPSMLSLMEMYRERGRRPPPPPPAPPKSRKRKAESAAAAAVADGEVYIITMADRTKAMDTALQDVEVEPGTRIGTALSKRIRCALVRGEDVEALCTAK
jgi:hypothetical protein